MRRTQGTRRRPVMALSAWASSDGAKIVALAALCLLSGCATASDPGEAAGSDVALDQRRSPIYVDDPLEGVNRRIYKFNALADRYVLLPIVNTYEYIVPLVLRDRVSDVFANIDNLTTFANQILQLKFKEAFETALRFGANTTFGFLGLADIATPMGLPKYNEDFGQTLGHWGVGGGAYLVLPILGPSNVRDTVGFGVDTAAFALADPFGISSFESDYPPVLALDAINSRYTQSFRYYESGSPFEYDLVRFLYTKKREVEIGDIPEAAPTPASAKPPPVEPPSWPPPVHSP